MAMTHPRTSKPVYSFLPHGRKWIAAAIVLLVSAVAWSGEKSLAQLDLVSRYFELKNEAERRLAGGEGPNSSLIGYSCIAYVNLRQYDKLSDCLNELDRHIQQGDVTIGLDLPGIFVRSYDVRPLPHVLRAQAFLDFGDYRQVIDSGEKALALLAGSSDMSLLSGRSAFLKRQKVIVESVMALAAVHTGNKELADRLIEELEGASSSNSAYTGSIPKIGLARTYMTMGKYDMALEKLQDSRLMKFGQSLIGSLDVGASGDDSLATYTELPRLLMIAKANAETQHISAAKAILGQVLANSRIKDLGDIHWVALFERGRIAETEKEFAEASEYYRHAVEIVELQRSSINTEASKIGFVGDKQALYGRLVAVLIGQGRVAEAFDYVERSKSRALVDMLATKQDFAAGGSSKAGNAMLARLNVADLESRSHIALKTEESGSGRRTLQVVRQELRSTAPELSTLVSVSSVPPDELRPLIRPDETLVEYYYQGTELYVFVLNRAGLKAVRLDADGLVTQTQVFRKGIENPQSNEWTEVSRALYARLWQPLEGDVPGSNVIVVAHGVLHYLPFAALQRADGSFLVDRHNVRLLPSASVLKFLKPTLTKKRAPVLAFGNPDLGDPKLDLQFAEDEAKTVTRLYPASKLFTRKAASETAFKQSATTYSRIHLASHGKFQADAPLTSGLYLAGDASNDGLLTVGELYSMSINADLVTLSACETGLGKIANGDDVVGLTRGFLYAGSRAIVASLWSVDDKATAELMQVFYKNLASMDKSEALRQAQLKSRQTYPHPYYWAAFQLTGRSD